MISSLFPQRHPSVVDHSLPGERCASFHRRSLFGGSLLKPAITAFYFGVGLAVLSPVGAAVFQLPTANHAILEPGKEEQFFVGTVGKPWTSGTFGCVRTDGWQMHEGLDI